jgi:hypothetical protein
VNGITANKIDAAKATLSPYLYWDILKTKNVSAIAKIPIITLGIVKIS